MEKDLVIIGTGLNSKQVYDFIKQHNLFNIIGFAIDAQYKTEDEYMGLPVWEIETLKSKIDVKKTRIFVSLGWNHLNAQRRTLYLRLKKEGYSFANLISPLAVIRGRIEGDNCWVNDYTIMQSDSVIKSNVQIRELAVIGNGTVIEEHVFIGINGIVGGSSVIGEQTFIGMRGTVFDGVKVGKKCLIGASAVVKRHLPDFSGCRVAIEGMVIKNYSEDEIEGKLVVGKGTR